MVKCEGEEEAKQRIYAARTKDFKQFTEPFVYLERKNHVIDTTMIEMTEFITVFPKMKLLKTS